MTASLFAPQTRAILCSALLAAGRPVSPKELTQLIGGSRDALELAVQDLRETLSREGLGLVVEEVAGGYRLVVAPGLVPALAGLLSPPPLPALSNAALETLAIVAYKQPVTRGEVEAARGASCSSTLETLQERELVKVIGRKDVVGQPLLYGTTERFLLEFGLRSLDDLPALEGPPESFLRG
jgi:segregation and condensation protein B